MKLARGSDDFTDMHGASNFEGAVDVDRDRALVERCQAGDLTAFDTLYLHYNQRLLRFCLKRLQERSESEDVVQETFARAWRALPTFAGDRRFYPWLTVIAGNLCTDALRRRARTTTLDETIMRTSDTGSYDIEDAVLRDVDAEMVTTAFENLKPRHQRVLDLRERSGWSYQRIADQEGVGVSAVETLLWRARNALKREFALLAGAEGKAGALIGVAMTLPRVGIRRLSTAFRHHVAVAFRHLAETGRHVAGAVTPAGASIAAAGAVVVGLGAVYFTPGASTTAAPAVTGPTGSTVAPSTGGPALGTTLPPATTSSLPPSTASAAGTAPAGGSAAGGGGRSGGAVGGAGAPSTQSVTEGSWGSGGSGSWGGTGSSGGTAEIGATGNDSSGTPPGAASPPNPVAAVTQPISGVTGAVGGVVAGTGATAGAAVSGLANGVGGAVTSVGGAVAGAASTGGSAGSGLGQVTTGVTGAVGGVVSSAGSGLGQAVTGVTGGVSTLLGGPPG